MSSVDLNAASSAALSLADMLMSNIKDVTNQEALQCQIRQQTNEECNIGSIVVDNCSATITCDNTADNKVYSNCNLPALSALAGRVTAGHLNMVSAGASSSTGRSPAQVEKYTRLRMLLNGVQPPDAQPSATSDSIANYIAARCDPTQIASQVVTIPEIHLSNCSNITVTAYNALDSQAQCVVGAATGLVPPLLPPYVPTFTSSELAAARKRPSSGKGTALIIGLSAGAIVLLVIAIVGGIFARKADARAAASATVAQSVMTAPMAAPMTAPMTASAYKSTSVGSASTQPLLYANQSIPKATQTAAARVVGVPGQAVAAAAAPAVPMTPRA
jgi:hypothetical protein